MRKVVLEVLLSLSLASGVLVNSGPAMAGTVFVASGTGTGGDAIAAKAEFDFVQYDFGSGNVNAVKITLTNTTPNPPTTLVRGNLLTGLFWTLSDVSPTLTTTAAGFDGRAGTVVNANGTTSGNVDIAPAVNNTATDGTYQLNNLFLQADQIANDNVDYSAFKYGLATVAYGLGGFNGSDVGGDNYGIFAAGSTLANPGLQAARPLIDSSAMFWLARPAEWTSLEQITDVRFTFGSKPDNYLDVNVVPEPASLMLFGSGLAGLALWRWRKARASSVGSSQNA